MKNVIVIVNIVPLGLSLTSGYYFGSRDEQGNVHLEGGNVLSSSDEDVMWSIIEEK